MKLLKLSMLCVLLFTGSIGYGAFGCLNHCLIDGLYAVPCACPCTEIIEYRGRCRRCMHYGDPLRGEVNALQVFSPEVFM